MKGIMEKLMGIKKDGGQEVLMTLGLVALGVALLLLFNTSARSIITAILNTAKTNIGTALGVPIT